jgi:hypothetical protein
MTALRNFVNFEANFYKNTSSYKRKKNKRNLMIGKNSSQLTSTVSEEN